MVFWCRRDIRKKKKKTLTITMYFGKYQWNTMWFGAYFKLLPNTRFFFWIVRNLSFWLDFVCKNWKKKLNRIKNKIIINGTNWIITNVTNKNAYDCSDQFDTYCFWSGKLDSSLQNHSIRNISWIWCCIILKNERLYESWCFISLVSSTHTNKPKCTSILMF